MEHVTLLGAEKVQQAAGQMADAAHRMERAAASIENTLLRHQQFLDEWLARLEAALGKP